MKTETKERWITLFWLAIGTLAAINLAHGYGYLLANP